MDLSNFEILIASDGHLRDGIGVEIWHNDVLICELFRDDTKRLRTVTLYTQDLELELLEEFIAIFKKEIPWDFID